jgi:calcineurin-like phosphoesterase family protein
MTEKLIGNWNSIVPEDGLVFNLGDFCWTGSADVWNELLDRLNGQQVFIRGNHDNAKCLEKVRERFVDVRERLEIRYEDERFMLDHYPQVSWNGAAHAVRLLHGHLHEQDFQYATSSTYNVSLERNGYRPISMSEVYDILTVQHRENKVNLRLNNLFYNDNMY